ncbi:MAG: RsmE family RNA methyltransferase [Verrucomicrobiales bacterium]
MPTKPKRRDKWRNALEACKQCGANLVPDIAVPQTVTKALGALVRLAPGTPVSLLPFSGNPALTRTAGEHRENHGGDSPRSTFGSGPEGDFTPAELSQALTAGFRPLSLGPIVLRSETAALYALSVLGYELL